MPRGRRRHHPIVGWLVAVNVAFGLAYAVLTPLYRGPDEPRHVEMVRRYRSELGYSRPDQASPLTAAIAKSSGLMGPYAVPRPPQEERDAQPRVDRQPFSELAEPGATSGQSRNQLTQHPPLYYALTAGASTLVSSLVPAELWSWDREVLLYRVLSVLLTGALPLLASWAALALGLTRAMGALAAAVTMLAPMETYIGAVVNNDVLVVPLAGVAVAGALAYLAGGRPRSAYLAAAAAAGLALTKATGALVAPWVFLVVAVEGVRRWRRDDRRTAVGAGAVTAAILAVGASWYVVNLARFSDPQPTDIHLPPPPASFEPSLADYVPLWLDRVSSTFWGEPGRRTGVTLEWPVMHALTVLAVAAVVVALASRRPHRVPAVLLAGLCAVQVALMFRTTWRGYARWGREVALQGRYLYALLVPLAALAALAAWRFLRHRPHWRPRAALAVAAVGVVLHVDLAFSMLRRYWEVDDASWGQRLRSVEAWSSLPTAGTWLVLLAPLVVSGLGLGVLAARWVRRRARQPAQASPIEGADDEHPPGVDEARSEDVVPTPSTVR